MSAPRKLTPVEGRPDTGVGKVFMHGRSQAVRLPKEFRFDGNEVRLRRVPGGVIMEEVSKPPLDVEAWFAQLDSYGPCDLERPEQPPMPPIVSWDD